jgi:hypothetical protein
MSEHQIRQAANNTERKEVYKYQLGKYRKAMKEEFYFEALMIVYNMLEDRLKSFLYYSGALATRNGKLNPCSKTKADLRIILTQEFGEKEQFRMSTITGKIRLITAIVNWSASVELNETEASTYMCCLKREMESTDIGGILSVLKEIKEWLKYRNEVMHAAMNKNVVALYENLPEKIVDGMDYARYIDSQVKILKRKNKIRKVMKLQNN